MSSPMVQAFVGLGSNLDDPAAHLRQALAELDGIPDSRLAGASSCYRSEPMGPAGQPDYINAVAELETGLPPEALLTALHHIEDGHERVREQRWGPRTLDLDLLLYGDVCIDRPDLKVPHPGMTERNFVLVPLLELVPEVEIPGKGPAAAWQAQLGLAGLQRLDAE